jgi:hypothetical protein
MLSERKKKERIKKLFYKNKPKFYQFYFLNSFNDIYQTQKEKENTKSKDYSDHIVF